MTDGRKAVRSGADFASTKGVMLMGNGRWAQALRIVVWFIIVLLLMIATAQKAY